MIKFIIILSLVLLCYFLISMVGVFDSVVNISILHPSLGNYLIDSTVFNLACIVLFSLLVIFILFKVFNIMWVVFRAPVWFLEKYKIKKQENILEHLMRAMLCAIVGANDKSLEIFRSIKIISAPNYIKDYATFLLGCVEQNPSDKIISLEKFYKLKNYPDLKYLTARYLAQLYYQINDIEKAHDYAVKAFNVKENDIIILEILMHYYGKYKIWDKFFFIVTKINRSYKQLPLDISSKIAEYYYIAAQNMLPKNPQKAINYLKLALELCAKASIVKLYCDLSGNQNVDLVIIKKSLCKNPCMEIVLLYIQYCNLSDNNKIYSELKKIIPNCNDLLLSVAAFLDLGDQVKNLRAVYLSNNLNIV